MLQNKAQLQATISAGKPSKANSSTKAEALLQQGEKLNLSDMESADGFALPKTAPPYSGTGLAPTRSDSILMMRGFRDRFSTAAKQGSFPANIIPASGEMQMPPPEDVYHRLPKLLKRSSKRRSQGSRSIDIQIGAANICAATGSSTLKSKSVEEISNNGIPGVGEITPPTEQLEGLKLDSRVAVSAARSLLLAPEARSSARPFMAWRRGASLNISRWDCMQQLQHDNSYILARQCSWLFLACIFRK